MVIARTIIIATKYLRSLIRLEPIKYCIILSIISMIQYYCKVLEKFTIYVYMVARI